MRDWRRRQSRFGAAGSLCGDGQREAVDSPTLKEVGGTEGVGVTFLEETFSASTAPPEHRLRQKAAQAVLKSLLPGPAPTSRGK